MAAIDVGKAMEMKSQSRDKAIIYPTGDGRPLGEDESHVRETLSCIQFLQFWFRRRSDVYVIGNNFVYWNEGVPRDRLSPGCYVVFGVEKRIRPSYKSWEESGKLPDVVFEFTSRSTMRQDVERKFSLYEQVWKTQEYFLFDPNREYLTPPLQGYTLVDGRYVPMELAGNRLRSEQLGLDLIMSGAYLRFYDPVAGELIPTLGEASDQALSATRVAEDARSTVQRYEAENARLKAEIDELRRQRRGET